MKVEVPDELFNDGWRIERVDGTVDGRLRIYVSLSLNGERVIDDVELCDFPETPDGKASWFRTYWLLKAVARHLNAQGDLVHVPGLAKLATLSHQHKFAIGLPLLSAVHYVEEATNVFQLPDGQVLVVVEDNYQEIGPAAEFAVEGLDDAQELLESPARLQIPQSDHQ